MNNENSIIITDNGLNVEDVVVTFQDPRSMSHNILIFYKIEEIFGKKCTDDKATGYFNLSLNANRNGLTEVVEPLIRKIKDLAKSTQVEIESIRIYKLHGIGRIMTSKFHCRASGFEKATHSIDIPYASEVLTQINLITKKVGVLFNTSLEEDCEKDFKENKNRFELMEIENEVENINI